MSRLPSLDIPDAVYYVQLQDSGHEPTFASRQAFTALIDAFQMWTRNSGARLLGFCFLPDTAHMLVRTSSQGIESDLNALLVEFAEFTHGEANTTSHVKNGFGQKRLTTLLDPTHYLLPVAHQLHWLPVTCGLVPTPQAYPWSSHRLYLSDHPPQWLYTQDIFNQVGNHRASRLRRYERFIDNDKPPTVDWVEGVHSEYRALASDSFIQSCCEENNAIGIQPALSLSMLTEWVCLDYGLKESDLQLRRNHRRIGEIQSVVGALAKSFHIADEAKVAEYFATDKEQLLAGIRDVRARRDMYIFKLQLRLDQWLLENFRTDRNTEAASNTAPLTLSTVSASTVPASSAHANPIPSTALSSSQAGQQGLMQTP